MYSEANQAVGASTKQSPTVVAFGNLVQQQSELSSALYELRERLEVILSPQTPEKTGGPTGRPPGESRLVDEILSAAERESDSLACVRDILRRLTV